MSGLPAYPVNDLAIDPLRSSTIYAATSAGLFKSADAGSRWSSVPGLSAFQVATVAVDPTNSLVIYAAIQVISGLVEYPLFKSIDAGSSWAPVGTGLLPVWTSEILIDPSAPSTLYAATDAGIFRSRDGGVSWSELNTLPTPFRPPLLVDASTPTTLYTVDNRGIVRSSDGGETWRALDLSFVGGEVISLALDRVSKRIYAGTRREGVFRRSTSGGAWNPINTSLSGGQVNAVAVDRRNSSNVFAIAVADISHSYLGRSTNSGDDWSLGSTPIRDLIVKLIISPLDSRVAFALGGGGIWRTTDRGSNWTLINEGLPDAPRDLVLDPRDQRTIYATTPGGALFRRPEDATAWSPVGLPIGTRFPVSLAIDPANLLKLHVGTSDSGIYRSLDGGNTWAQTNTGLTELGILVIVIDPKNTDTVYAGTTSGAFKSVDGGTSWASMDSGLPRDSNGFLLSVQDIVLDPLDSSTLYLGTYASGFFTPPFQSGVFKSTNRGSTWAWWSRGLGNASIDDLEITEGGTSLHAATPGGVYSYTIASAAFHSVPPCRLLDTRETGHTPALNADSERNFLLSGKCGVPSTARSVALNLTVTAPAAGGHLTVYETGTPTPATFSISYSAGRTKANNAIVSLDPLGRVSVKCTQESGTVHFIADVTGYFE